MSMESTTNIGKWLERHGWKLEFTRPHGFAETHYWRSPHDGLLHTQTYAILSQRGINRRLIGKRG